MKRYLGNTNTDQVHDTQNEKTNCQLDEILNEHRIWYETLSAAKNDRKYSNCDYCLDD